MYHRPTTLTDALALADSEPDLTIVAGATDVYPAWTSAIAKGAAKPRGPVLDISRVVELYGIADRGDHWWLGATTTWSEIATADLPPLFNGLRAAAREIGGIQVQNRGTIGGNLCTASPAGDSIPCLLSLDAEVECAGTAQGRMPLAQFLMGYRRTAIGRGIVTGVRIPKRAGAGHFLKHGARRYLVISIAMVAGTFDIDPRDGLIRSARIAVGACSPVAQRLPRLEARLVGRRIGDVQPEPDDIAGLAPIDDVRASGAYRLAAAQDLVCDLLARAASHARGHA